MKLPRLLLPGVAVVAALGLVAVTFLTGDDPALVDTSNIATDTAPATVPETASATGDTAATPDTTDLAVSNAPSTARMDPLRVDNAAMTVGDPDAPLVMVTFESYGCGWCGHFHNLTMPKLMDEWVDTGRLRIESRMMPYEERALPGAMAGAAAGLQGKYWDLGEVMYPYIAGSGEPLFDREPTDAEMSAYRERQSEDAMLAHIESVADEIGLDYERFVTDFTSTEALQQVDTDTQIGYAVGFTGTPAFIVNGVPVGGFLSYERMDDLLTNVLADSVG